ncbi:hypothetical protein CDEF62S_05515 [Castellaniella defragrans]
MYGPGLSQKDRTLGGGDAPQRRQPDLTDIRTFLFQNPRHLIQCGTHLRIRDHVLLMEVTDVTHTQPLNAAPEIVDPYQITSTGSGEDQRIEKQRHIRD